VTTSTRPPGPDAGPRSPTGLKGRALRSAVVRTLKEFQRDNLIDWAAALTYYGVLSLFPGLLVMVSLLGLVDPSVTDELVGNLTELAPKEARAIITSALESLRDTNNAGLIALLGLLGAFWSASGYIGAFMRASNAIYDVPEGRPIWKTLPIRVGVTALTGLLLVISALIVVFTGRLAQLAGNVVGVGDVAVRIWDIAKWPVLVLLVSLLFALLYWASPNARQGGFRWISPGGLLAVLLWILASVGFSLYVANFGSYNKTYGALGGVIVFLVWLWISNIAVLFGAEFDAELERQRAASAGHPVDDEPYLRLRDDSKVDPEAHQGLGGPSGDSRETR